MSYFSQPKSERDVKIVKAAVNEPRLGETAPGRPAADIVSTLGHGMLITGNIVCAGSLQIFGRVIGDIHASSLIISDEGSVEGKIVAPDAVIKGKFHGAIHSNNVKLQSTAVVEGEIFNKSLAIEQNALFEGVSRRLDKPVEAPSNAHAAPERPNAQVVSLSDVKASV